MCFIEQIIGIIIIGICFAITLLYIAPVTIKDAIELFKEIFFEEKSRVNDNDGMPL